MLAFVIEFYGTPPSWVSVKTKRAMFGVTYQLEQAQRFASREEARNELAELRLSAYWFVAEKWFGKSEVKEKK